MKTLAFANARDFNPAPFSVFPLEEVDGQDTMFSAPPPIFCRVHPSHFPLASNPVKYRGRIKT
jgi:hypothetical protein